MRAFEENLASNQYAYSDGCNCTDALIDMQIKYLKALDDKHCTCVRLFAIDISKAFDNVKHSLLGRKLKSLNMDLYIVNWHLSFLKDRCQRLVLRGTTYQWREVNKGTTQGSVSGQRLFNLLSNDLDIGKKKINLLVKFADDTTILVKVCKLNDQLCKDIIDQYFRWSTINQMPCNRAKYRELVAQKKNKAADTVPVNGLKQVNKLKILGVTLQENNRFNEHVKNKLMEANRCLFALRTLRQEGYMQPDIDSLFAAIVLPTITYGLSVYAASPPDLNITV